LPGLLGLDKFEYVSIRSCYDNLGKANTSDAANGYDAHWI